MTLKNVYTKTSLNVSDNKGLGRIFTNNLALTVKLRRYKDYSVIAV